MSFDKFHMTEDVTVKELTQKDQAHLTNDDYFSVMLGTTITPEAQTMETSKKKKFEFKFRLDTFLDIKSSAIVSVKSLYQKLLITNHSIVKKYWDVVIELTLAYNVITTLFFLAYQYPSGGMLVVDYIHWILFMIDIGLTFFTEILTDKGVPIRQFNKIALSYITGWLFFDVLAIIPLRSVAHEEAEYLLRMVRLLKLQGVLDITDGTGVSYLLTYFNLGKREKNGKISYSYTSKIIASLIKLFIVLIFIVYFLGCLWFWFQKTVNNFKYSQNSENFNELNFQETYGLTDMESKDVALRSSYYMMTTISTIGYGDFLPQNIYEMSFVLVVMLFGVTMFAVIMANFNNAISYYTEATSGVDYLGELNSWLDTLERANGTLNKILRAKIIDHFTYYYSKDRLKSLAKTFWTASSDADLISISQDYVSDLPEEIYYDILENLYSDFFYIFKYFLGDSKLKYAIVPHLQPRKFLQQERLLQHNEKVTEVMFIMDGNLSIGIDVNGKHQTLLFCEHGRTVVGDYCTITKLRNKFDYVAETKMDVLVINSEVFNKIIDGYYKSQKTAILAVANKREINLKRLYNDHLKNMSNISMASERNAKEKDQVILGENLKDGDFEFNEDQVEHDLAMLGEVSAGLEVQAKKILTVLSQTEEARAKAYSGLAK